MHRFEITKQEQTILKRVQRQLGYTFKNQYLLLEALTHRSAFNKLKALGRPPYNYERLEFLGDAVLQLVVGEWLYRERKSFSEGDMTKIRASLVNTERLADALRRIRLNQYIILGVGEAKDKGNQKDHILAAVFEAIVGAIYVDGGLRRVKAWLRVVLWEPYFKRVVSRAEYIDPKMALQEITQREFGVLPEYETIAVAQAEYKVRVKIQGKEYATASGTTLKKAQKLAAQKTIKKLQQAKIKSKQNVKN